MQSSIKIACMAAALFAGSSTLALAQGGSTDSRGNAMGSEHVGNGAATTGGAMHNGSTVTGATTGMGGTRSGNDSPNGSPNAAPTAKQGPGGDPSRNNDAPK